MPLARLSIRPTDTIGVNGPVKDWVNGSRDDMGTDGALSRVRQEFGWRESLEW